MKLSPLNKEEEDTLLNKIPEIIKTHNKIPINLFLLFFITFNVSIPKVIRPPKKIQKKIFPI